MYTPRMLYLDKRTGVPAHHFSFCSQVAMQTYHYMSYTTAAEALHLQMDKAENSTLCE